jgi:hypothetical protein
LLLSAAVLLLQDSDSLPPRGDHFGRVTTRSFSDHDPTAPAELALAMAPIAAVRRRPSPDGRAWPSVGACFYARLTTSLSWICSAIDRAPSASEFNELKTALGGAGWLTESGNPPIL